jgi:PAS domain S-box-containing protein
MVSNKSNKTKPLTAINHGKNPLVMNNMADSPDERDIKYFSIYNSMSDGIAIHEVIYDKSGKAVNYIITDVNPAFEKITGLEKSSILGKKATEAYLVNTPPFLDTYADVAESATPAAFETFFAPFNKHFQISVFSHGKGKFATIFQDITERKLISDTHNFLLSNSYSGSGKDFFESLAKFLAQILGMDYVCIDKLEGDNLTARTVAIYNDGKFDTNVTYSLKETPCGDVVGKTICCFPRNVCELFPNDPALAELFAEGYIGTTLWSFTGKPIGLIAVIGRKPIENPHIAETILKLVAIRAAGELERKNAQEVIVESEDRFRTIAETVPVLVCVTRIEDSVVLFTNEVNNKAFGYCGEEIIGTKGPDYYCDPNDRVSMLEMMKKDGSVNNYQLKVKKSDGTPFWIITSVQPIIYHGQPALIGASLEITELLKTEEKLLKSEQKLKYHLENSPLAVVEWDKDFNIIQWSGEAERIFGLKREETLGVSINLLNIIYPEDLGQVEKTIKRLTRDNELKVISHNRNVRKTGEVIDCIWYNSVLKDENGEMSSVMSLVEDITLLRKTEKDLLASRESYMELVTNARSVIIKMDTSGRCIFVNEFALDFFGYSREEMLGISVMDTIVPKKESTGRDLRDMADKIIEDPDNFSININENIKKNGDRVWIEWHNKALYDDSGTRTGHIGIGIDVTEKRIAEEGLKENQSKLRTVLNATRESIYMFDHQGIICMSNSTGIERLKRSNEHEVVGHNFSEFMLPEVAMSRQRKLDEVFANGKALEYEDERDCNIYHHSYVPVFKDNEVSHVVTYSRDVTESKRAESKIMESEDRFRTIAESLTVMISIVRICDTVITFTNEPFERTFGFGKDETADKKYPYSFYSAEEFKKIREILKNGGSINNREILVKKSDGSPFWIMLSVRKINFLNEPSYISISIDISDTKRNQLELLRLNRLLNAHSKSSHSMMHSDNEIDYVKDVCKIIIEDCGHSMVWIGYTQDDERKSVVPVAHYGFDAGYIDQLDITWDDTDRGRGPTGTAIRTGKYSLCRNMLTDPSFKPWKKAAMERGYASSLVMPLISDGKPFGAISIYSKEPDPFSDAEINLIKELADDLAYGISVIRLAESERAAAIAIKENEAKLKDLVATKDKFFNIVAHDLKNPFTSLLGSSELLYDNIDQMTPDNVKELAMILNDSAKGGYAILQNLLDWSRSQTGLLKFNPENLNLREIIDENIYNFQLQVTNKEINLSSELNENLLICADKNMINTVLRNLLSNAVKYTYKNGNISVLVTDNHDEVVISVKDSGIGISKEKAETLFRIENSLSQPGTEKEQGTGLGLKLCKEFTEKMGGRIWIESDSGKGSEFKFTIPVNGTKAQRRNGAMES